MKPILILLICMLLLGGCRDRQQEAAPVLLQVDQRSLTLQQFDTEFNRTLPGDQVLSPEEEEQLKRAFLVQVIDRQLALAEAERLGIQVSPQEIDRALDELQRDYPAGGFQQMLDSRGITLKEWRQELHDSLLMEKVLRREVYAGVKVDPAEVEAYYQEHRKDYDRPQQVRARQIVVASEAEGQRVLGLLRQGEPFAEVARAHSLSPDAEQGGDLGFFARGEMPPEFDQVVFKLQPGLLSDLVKTEYGFHVFLVEERRKAVRLELDEVRDEIRARLRSDKEERAYHRWLQRLRAQAQIKVAWNLL